MADKDTSYVKIQVVQGISDPDDKRIRKTAYAYMDCVAGVSLPIAEELGSFCFIGCNALEKIYAP